MFLLPVPASPIVCQLSSIRASSRGTIRNVGFAVSDPSDDGAMVERRYHCALSQPLAKLQIPDARYPPSTATVLPAGAYEPAAIAPGSLQNSSCASFGKQAANH